MATVVQPPKHSWNRAETDTRVRHPLQRLRSYIRAYVTLEGASIFLLYLVIWFWIGLILDYGVFKLFAYDWVQEMPKMVGSDSFAVLRIGMLVVLLSGLLALVAVKVVLRLVREFRDSALALVLERRFPEQLGDRLITAVEMADPRLSEKYGHSQPLLDQTIRDAADRVDKLPVKEVFNWKRLTMYGLTLAGLVIGLFGLIGAAYCLLSGEEPMKYVYRSRDVALIWTQRNLLLQDVMWPRSAYLEVIRFKGSKKDKDEMRIGDNNPSAELWVRAVEWVIADPNSPDGWRALRWHDLENVLGYKPKVHLPDNWDGWTVDVDDLDPSVPLYVIPDNWRGKTIRQVQQEINRSSGPPPELLGVTLPRPLSVKKLLETNGQYEAMERSLFAWQEWTVDRIALQVEDDPSVRLALHSNHPEAYTAFKKVFEDLEELVESGAMERQLRKLDVPQQAVLKSYGETNKNRKSFTKRENNKYQVQTTLTESVRFVVQGEDYYTTEKKITLVPRPRLKELKTDRWEPAYIYWRLKGPAGNLQSQLPLAGQRQFFAQVAAPVSDQQSFIEVPAGSSIELFAETTDLLKEKPRIEVAKKADEGGLAGKELLETNKVEFVEEGGVPNPRKFKTKFTNVTRTLDFLFKFTNEDNVDGECHIVIEPKIDRHPEVSVQIIENVFRKKPNTEFYMVTPKAEVPFKGNITDDRGLNRVEWAFQVSVVKQEATQAKVLTALTAHSFMPGGINSVVGPAYLAWLSKRMKAAQESADQKAAVETKLMPKFVDETRFREAGEIKRNALAKKLTDTPPTDALLKQIILKADEEKYHFHFNDPPLDRLDSPGRGVFQTRYLVELWVLATDNNVENKEQGQYKPVASESKQRFTFMVVGENELLAEVFREEEDQRIDLEKIYAKVQAARTRLETQVLPGLSPEETPLSADLRGNKATRADEVKKIVHMNGRDIGNIRAAFERMLLELRYNKVGLKNIARVRDQIVEPLRQMMDKNRGEFKQAEDAAEKLAGILESNLKGRVRAGQVAKEKMDQLIDRLKDVLDNMQDIIGKDQLLRMAVELEQKQRKQTETLEAHERYIKDLIEIELTGAGEKKE